VNPSPDTSGVGASSAAGSAAVGLGGAAPGARSALEPDVQIVRFQGPPGLSVEVLAPTPVPVSAGEPGGVTTVGLMRGVGYRLRVNNIPERPGVELFPMIEVVGHLHRPDDIDPAKYPIRVIFSDDDLYATADRARLVTKVIYLEDPDQAFPYRMAKDDIPVVTLNPTELPLQVARALGRPVAIVRLGGRKPTIEEIQGGAYADAELDGAARLGTGRCSFLTGSGKRCSLPCGPLCTASRPPARPLLPRDEYLCDGGDRGVPAAVGPTGRLGGIEPRDAVVGFDIGLKERSERRALPTNVVCVYAPRFAEVRVVTATNENVEVQGIKTDKALAKYQQATIRVAAKRLTQNQGAELARARTRASALKGRVSAGEESANRGPNSFSGSELIATNIQKQAAELTRTRQQPAQAKLRVRLEGIKTVESPVVRAIAEGASEVVRVWGPQEMAGAEVPPNRPGLAVIKQVTPAEAQPGDTLSYVITYRNMGNTPIRDISIADSLLPRLEFKPGTSRGPAGTRFTTALNVAGSTELRWELPGVLAPGAMGQVSFEAIVR
jgi:uncharacterized repeat protein (TIGR01451 family)